MVNGRMPATGVGLPQVHHTRYVQSTMTDLICADRADHADHADRAEARTRRAAMHRALGDERRLEIAGALWASDRSFSELASLTGMPTNLLAFHLDTLERAQLVARQRSEGDRRRRYLTLLPGAARLLDPPDHEVTADADVLFVCTANSARSQLAAALWRARTGRPAASAGTHPARRVHPRAVAVARRHGLDLAGARPRRLDEVERTPALVVSVCDRANEEVLDLPGERLHWSVPDPVPGPARAFEDAYSRIDERIARLARAA
jgi:ArsR family transcriptional regulator, arsenate/arsenite/antimonite-responsive transcriptional repressor / arsenate reductase (thioredoxin)